MKLTIFKKQVILFSLALLFISCEDKTYIKTIYDKNLINKQITCLKLKLSPYNDEIYDNIKNIYHFTNTCNNKLEISYKSNIACNSNFNTNKSFNSYMQIELKINNKRVYSIYKDLKDANISNEIKKGYKILCKKIKI